MSEPARLQLPETPRPWWASLIVSIISDDKTLCRAAFLLALCAVLGFHVSDVPAGKIVRGVAEALTTDTPASSATSSDAAPAAAVTPTPGATSSSWWPCPDDVPEDGTITITDGDDV